ncbi:gamma-glutamyltransferase family protein [Flaviflagellibacter deserti]|uniref:Gamma-glutamyltransferase family protein n=1 Tax=Flaviflagellibacter deserti TaxID=2267266 RepID=A0ABV9Z2C5_9HYPH
MLNTVRARRGMVTSPHHLASEAGLRILRDGGNAIEATVAMAAALAVVYPHMNGIGGDGFWLIAAPGQEPVAVEACGQAAALADVSYYRERGFASIPTRGPLAANTVAATVSGWGEALRISSGHGGALPLSRLVEDAVWYADEGFPVTASQNELTVSKLGELRDVPGFVDAFLAGGSAPATGETLKSPALARTLHRIGRDGVDDFYTGALAREIAADLETSGSPVRGEDLERHRARSRAPLSMKLPGATLYNFPPPTQGLSSLMILGIFSRLGVRDADGFSHIHGLVEATKQAFLVRDRIIGDPDAMAHAPDAFLDGSVLDSLAHKIDPGRALPWPAPPLAGDTVWLGAIDKDGISASFIQSIFFEFGSGLVLPQTGVLWQNRGASFVLSDDNNPRALRPGRRPFHTLNPAFARFDDGRDMVYGTMGGEGQPQTQAAIFSRYAMFGQELQTAVTAPRWLLGRTWGEESVTLKLENRFSPDMISELRAAGHNVEVLDEFTSTMGHAGAIVRQKSGLLEGAADPRSDGAANGF